MLCAGAPPSAAAGRRTERGHAKERALVARELTEGGGPTVSHTMQLFTEVSGKDVSRKYMCRILNMSRRRGAFLLSEAVLRLQGDHNFW